MSSSLRLLASVLLLVVAVELAHGSLAPSCPGVGSRTVSYSAYTLDRGYFGANFAFCVANLVTEVTSVSSFTYYFRFQAAFDGGIYQAMSATAYIIDQSTRDIIATTPVSGFIKDTANYFPVTATFTAPLATLDPSATYFLSMCTTSATSNGFYWKGFNSPLYSAESRCFEAGTACTTSTSSNWNPGASDYSITTDIVYTCNPPSPSATPTSSPTPSVTPTPNALAHSINDSDAVTNVVGDAFADVVANKLADPDTHTITYGDAYSHAFAVGHQLCDSYAVAITDPDFHAVAIGHHLAHLHAKPDAIDHLNAHELAHELVHPDLIALTHQHPDALVNVNHLPHNHALALQHSDSFVFAFIDCHVQPKP